MATSVQLAEKLATLFNARVSTCSNTYKHLQAADLVSRGGRGRHAAPITANDAVMLLFALIGSEHLNDGSEAARRYSSLVAKWRDASDAYVMEKSFPRLKSLDAGHSLLAAVVALIDSYKDGVVPTPEPTISVTIRGPQISATIRFEGQDGVEKIDYGPASGRDMFRTIIGNPNNTNIADVSKYLHVEKRITADTLRAIGELLR